MAFHFYIVQRRSVPRSEKMPKGITRRLSINDRDLVRFIQAQARVCFAITLCHLWKTDAAFSPYRRRAEMSDRIVKALRGRYFLLIAVVSARAQHCERGEAENRKQCFCRSVHITARLRLLLKSVDTSIPYNDQARRYKRYQHWC